MAGGYTASAPVAMAAAVEVAAEGVAVAEGDAMVVAAGAGALTGDGAVAFTAGGTGAVACTLVEPASLALGFAAAGVEIDAGFAGAGAAASMPLAWDRFLRRGGISRGALTFGCGCKLEDRLLKPAWAKKMDASPRSRRVSGGPESSGPTGTGRGLDNERH